MDSDAKRRVAEKVREILGAADMDTVTEQKVRELAAASLGVDLSDIDSKRLVRDVVEAFLLSTCDDDDRARASGFGLNGKENANSNLNLGGEGKARVSGDGLEGKDIANSKSVVEGRESGAKRQESSEHCNGGEAPANGPGDGGIRFLCKLSNKRSVAIKDSAKEKVVLIGEFLWKDGNRVPGSRGISLTGEQWMTFRKSFPAIEDAISKVKLNLRSELERKPIESDDKFDCRPSNAEIRNGPEFKKPKFVPAAVAAAPVQRQTEKTTAAAAAPKQKLDIYPIEIVRFDGKNYHDWARRVELFLKQLNLAYVLADPCPSAAGANTREIRQILAAAQKWMDDDYLCRTNILSSLSDHLFDSFSKKPGSAKELWDELRLLYLAEEYGSKTSLVKKYMEFQMVEEKSAVNQAQELNELADSLVPYGIHVDESFHVNAIISKLPSSWKNVAVKMMMEDNLPVWMLMNSLKQEEELRRRGKRGASPTVPAHDAELPRGRRGWQPAYTNRPGVVPPKFAPERERKVLFCTICKRKGHLEEKCWFKNSKDERGQSSTAGSEPEERGLK